MNWVDFVIIGAFGLAIFSGYRRGALLQLFSWGGLVVGLFIGATVSPFIVRLINPKTTLSKAVVAIIGFLGIAFVMEALIATLGIRLRKKITSTKLATTDQALGAIIAALFSVIGSWLLGVTFARGPSPQLAKSIKQSTILRAINKVAPPAPAILAQIGHFFDSSGFPQVFAQLNPSLAPGVAPPPPELARNKAILAAAELTYKVESTGCGPHGDDGVVDGSGFPVGGDMFITAAHVVAGTHDTRLIPASGGERLRATVVYVDTNHDIAVLHATTKKSLAVVPEPAKYKQDGAAIGYPGGGKRTISPARVRARTDARGYDIYSQKSVTRTIYVLYAHVIQGNSGGPFVDTEGRVRGMIFAASASNGNESYALAENEVERAMSRAKGKTQRVSTGSCAL